MTRPPNPPEQAGGDAAQPSQRLDVWLWCARFRRGRDDCARMVEAGAIRINRRPVGKPATRVRPGDVLTIAVGPEGALADRPGPDTGRLAGAVRVVRILALDVRRGPPEAARRLFEEIA